MAELMIRKAVPEDAEQIAGLLQELGYPNTATFAGSKIMELSRSDNDRLLVAEEDSAVIGVGHLHVCELFHEPGSLGRIMAIVVRDSHRRSGVGRLLLNTIEAVAREAGCTKMEITSGVHRDGAHAFYESLGYIEKPRRFVKVLDGGKDDSS